MALPAPLRNSVIPHELELIASEQLVEIIPLVAMERTAFISGAYGPLRPPAKCKVPIWMAANLKMKKKCHIVAPHWLNTGTSYLYIVLVRPSQQASEEWLQEVFTEETSESAFSKKLPFRYTEIAKVLLDVASDDLQAPDKIRSVLKDIREARQAKTRQGLPMIDHSDLALPGLCALEINEIRSVFVRSMGVSTQLTKNTEEQPMDQD